MQSDIGYVQFGLFLNAKSPVRTLTSFMLCVVYAVFCQEVTCADLIARTSQHNDVFGNIKQIASMLSDILRHYCQRNAPSCDEIHVSNELSSCRPKHFESHPTSHLRVSYNESILVVSDAIMDLRQSSWTLIQHCHSLQCDS